MADLARRGAALDFVGLCEVQQEALAHGFVRVKQGRKRHDCTAVNERPVCGAMLRALFFWMKCSGLFAEILRI